MPQARAQTRKRHCDNETPPPTATKRVRQLQDDTPNLLAYQQIDLKSHQIRILHLLPGKPKDPIRCVLHTAFLDDNPTYEALSYAWGDPLDCRSVEVDGRKKSITVNLYHALRRLRYPRRERRLWADALCINQDDDVEKSHQVNLMRKIYSRTKRAILWLGDFSNGPIATTNQIPRATATAAFAFLKSLAANHHYDSGHEEVDENFTSRGTAGLCCLFQLPWWHRAWTAQEAILPANATVVCGTAQLPFPLLWPAHRNSVFHYLRGCCGRVKVLEPVWNQLCSINCARDRVQSRTFSVSEALNIFRPRHASDPRDRVYAYLGFGSEILANYSLPHEEVFKLATRSLIIESGTLKSLLRTDEEKRSPTLPTWVPDWCANFSERRYTRELNWFHLYPYYRAAGDVKAATRVSSSDAVLDLQGLVLDRISAVGPILDRGSRIKDTMSEWQQKHNSEYPHGGTYKEASLRTLMGGIYRGQTSFRRLKSSDNIEKITKNDLGEFRYEVVVVASSRRGFSTNTGMIGLGNQDIRAGDFIGILGGGNMPFILRQVEGHEGGVAYQYIGQAYVHGIMDGEMMDEFRDLDWISLL